MTYNIVCIADEGYAQHTAVMLASLVDHNRDKHFRVFLLSPDMSATSAAKLQSVLDANGSALCLINNDGKSFGIDRLETSTWNAVMYLKTFLPQLLPSDVERCLFMDVDMIVRHDIAPLYSLPLHGCLLAGCEDNVNSMGLKLHLGLAPTEKYINSGVMVVDVKAWREEEKRRPMADFLQSHAHLIVNDQDAIALYFKGLIRYITDLRWNAVTFAFQRFPRVMPCYYDQLEAVRQNPYIVHFCEPVKPWYRECRHPYGSLYRSYLEQTPWRGAQLPSCGTLYGHTMLWYRVCCWLNRIGLRRDYWYETPLHLPLPFDY